MSVGMAAARRPMPRISSATASSSSRLRAATQTSTPASARVSAMALPMPRPAPVTIAFLPSMENSGRVVTLRVPVHSDDLLYDEVEIALFAQADDAAQDGLVVLAEDGARAVHREPLAV